MKLKHGVTLQSSFKASLARKKRKNLGSEHLPPRARAGALVEALPQASVFGGLRAGAAEPQALT